MLSRFLAVSFAAVFSVVPGASEAKELTAGTLGHWLCQAVLADRPERLLQAFPGAASGQVQPRVEKLWRDRPGRMDSPTQYIWGVRTAAFDVEYRHLERPGKKYNFHIGIRIRISSRDGQGAKIFDSNAEIERWLSRVGKVRREDGIVEERREDGTMDKQVLIVPHFEAVGAANATGGYGWRVTVGTGRQDVDVWWTQDENKKSARGFCS